MKIKNPIEKLITLGAVIAVALVMYFLNVGCFFKLLFKIPCPGCGISRALFSLIKLDFVSAFKFNPMFWSVPILVLLYLFDGKLFKYKWLNHAVLTGILIGFFAFWIVSLVNG